MAALARTTIERTSAMVTALIGAEVVRPQPPLGFVHPLIGSAVLLDMGSVDRTLAHERAARLLQHQLAVAENLVEGILQSRKQRDLAARMSQTPTRPVASFIDRPV